MGNDEWDAWFFREAVREKTDRLLDEGGRGGAQEGGAYVWTPISDVLETGEAVTVLVELPGVTAERVVVEVVDGHLVVRGERPFRHEEPEAAYHLLERAHGAFARRFPLPAGADVAAARASLRDGLLTIIIPKRARRMPARFTLILD